MRIANAENRFRLTYSQNDETYYEGRKAGNYVIAGIGIYMGVKGLAGIAGGIHKELMLTGGFTGGGALAAEVVEVVVISGSGTAAIELIEGSRITLSAIGGILGSNGKQNSSDLKNFYNSIKESPNYPEGFTPRQHGTTSNKVNNGELLEKLREIESGTWKKVYKDGYDAFGNEISIHYFQSQSGKVFDVKVKSGWSN